MSKSRKSVSGVSDNNVNEAQRILRERLTGNSLPPKIHGYTQERSRLLDLLKRTATLGEGNSLLLVGPRGSGKTMLLKSVVAELQEIPVVKENLLTVNLNGLIQTDDRIALKEITRQLQLENSVGDKVFGSFAETLQFLLDSLKSGGHESKPILFILEEIDLFAHHKNQTLLYNLFDISQSAQTPVCVVGLTCRLDALELLEKRVKSRFSHRQLHLLPGWSFDEYVAIAQTYLELPSNFSDSKFAKEWNSQIKALCADSSFQDILRRQFHINKDVRALQTILLLPVCQLSESQPFPKPSHFVDSAKHYTLDSKAAMLHGISILELCLIIAMKHLTEIYEGEPFNFEMVLRDYQKFSQKTSSMQMFDRAVVLKAFEHLCALELVRPVDGSGVKVQKEYRLMSLLVETSQITEALQKYPGCPTDVKQWASSVVMA